MRIRRSRAIAAVCVSAVVIAVLTVAWSATSIARGVDGTSDDAQSAPWRAPHATLSSAAGASTPPLGAAADVSRQFSYAEGPHGGTLALTPEEQQHVYFRHRTIVSGGNRSGCPNRYLFVNTHTYGRHHNQLQEMLNLAMWAKRLGRTAVLGWFRFDHRWTYAGDLYNFSRIMQSYCVVSPHEMMARVRGVPEVERKSLTAVCLGQKLDGTPMKRLTHGMFRCRADPAIPAHFNTRAGMRVAREYFVSKIRVAHETLVVLSGQLAFFLRAGLVENAAIFGLLEPAERPLALWKDFQTRTFGAASPGRYFGIHLRQREKECMKEVMESREDGGAFLADMTDTHWKVIATQCAMTVEHLQALMLSLNLLIDHQPMFVGSDHQNLLLEKALLAKGAVMFTAVPEANSLVGLALDYFMLADGEYFTGNQLSSITQNVCYRRLGRGLACHGFVPSFTRYHARNVETGKDVIRWFGVLGEEAENVATAP